MEIVNSGINQYVDDLLPDRPQVFREMEARAQREGFPIVGPQVGTLLELLARAIGARQVIELGSGFGYSGLWLARGLESGSRIILTDHSEENKRTAERNFAGLGLREMLDFRLGNAVAIFTQEAGPFDLIFNDVDKEEYPAIIDLAYPRLRRGGLLVTDNTLWSGQVVAADPDVTTQRIQEFNRKLAAHQGFLTVQIPIRDGVAVSVKR